MGCVDMCPMMGLVLTNWELIERNPSVWPLDIWIVSLAMDQELLRGIRIYN